MGINSEGALARFLKGAGGTRLIHNRLRSKAPPESTVDEEPTHPRGRSGEGLRNQVAKPGQTQQQTASEISTIQ